MFKNLIGVRDASVRRTFVGALMAGVLILPTLATAEDGPYEINAILGITGSSAFVGLAQQATLNALEASVNAEGGIKGQLIHFVVSDNQSSPQLTVQLTNAAVAKKAQALLVSGLLASCKAVEPMLQAKGPVEYCLSPSLYPAKDSFAFSAGISSHDFLVAELRYFRARGMHRLASITSNDATGQDADTQLDLVLGLKENKSVSLVAHERFAPTDLSAVAQIEKIKNAKPDMVIVWATGTPFGTILRNMRDTGFEIPVITSSGNMSLTQMKQYAPFAPKDVYFPGVGFQANLSATAGGKAAQTKFFDALKKSNMESDYLTGVAWDPAMIIIDAVRQLGTKATSDQIRRFILEQRSYPGISGIYDFKNGEQRGLSTKDVVIFRWDGQRSTWNAVSALGGTPSPSP